MLCLWKKLMVIFCLVTFCMAEGSIKLTATHKQINAVSTTDFALNCTYEGKNKQVQFLQLSKLTKKGARVGVLKYFVTMDAKSKIHILSPSKDINYTGGILGILGKVKAHLSAKWSRVPQGSGGIYRCKAKVIDTVGHVKSLYSQIRVEEKSISLAYVVAAIEDLQASEQRYRKKLLAFEQRYRSVLSTLSKHQKWNDGMSYTVKLLEWTLKKGMIVESKKYRDNYYAAYTFTPGVVRYAEAYCRIRGGYLAELTDLAEWSFVSSFLNGVGSSKKGFVVSGRRKGSSKRFYWPRIGENKSATFQWNRGQPDNNGAVENCVAMIRSHGWKLNDVDCSTPDYGFICEILWSEQFL